MLTNILCDHQARRRRYWPVLDMFGLPGADMIS